MKTAGARGWLSVAPNNHFGVRFDDLEFFVALNIHLGAPLQVDDGLCARCGRPCDKYGHHALHCQKKNMVTWRHDTLRDEINKQFREAGYSTTIEQRWRDVDLARPNCTAR